MKAWILATVLLALPGCLTGPTPANGSVDAAQDPLDWFALGGLATPEGAVVVFNHTVPAGASHGPDERGYYTWTFNTRLLVAPANRDAFVEWAFFVFDRFEDGPHQGKARPQNYLLYPKGTDWRGFPVAVPSPTVVNYEPQDYYLRNRSSFDGRALQFLVAARADPAVPFAMGIQELRGRPMFAQEPFGSLLPEAPPAEPGRILDPVSTASGFGMSVFSELMTATSAIGFVTPDVRVTRATGDAARGASAGVLEFESSSAATGGWTLAITTMKPYAGAGTFELEASYRGRPLSGSGPTMGTARQGPALPTLDHYVYREGPGPTSFRVRLSYAEAPMFHRIEHIRFDVGTPLSELLGGPVFDFWDVAPRPVDD